MKMLVGRKWFDCEAEKFKAEFLAAEHPSPFAWTYFVRAAVRALDIVKGAK